MGHTQSARMVVYLPSFAHVRREALRARLEELANADHCGTGGGGGQFTGPAAHNCETPAAGAGAGAEGGAAGGPFPEGWNKKGKPNPGGKEWLAVHGISPEVFADRPYVRFEQGAKFSDLPAAVQAAYEGEPEAVRQFNKIADQSSGFIMVRQSAPGSPEKGIVPQTRPDVPIVTDKGAQARAQTQLSRAQARAEDISSRGADGIVGLQSERVAKAEERLAGAKVATREGYLKYSTDRLAGAVADRDAAKAAFLEKSGKNSIAAANKAAAGDPALAELSDGYQRASDAVTKAQRTLVSSTKDADFKFGADGSKTDQYRSVATENASKALAQAQAKLVKYQGADAAGRKDFFAKEVENAGAQVDNAQRRLDETAVKYVFPPNPSRLEAEIARGEVLGKAGRVNAHMAENVARLEGGKGRVYLAMEGNIKEDALLTAVKAEGDKTASVISVPSVTLWRNKDMQAIAEKNLQGREVVLIPDADGVHNPRVRNEARALQSYLESVGAKVVVAPPPIPLKNGVPVPDPAHAGKMLQYEVGIPGSPTGAREQLKGVDDYLGLGKGTEAKGTLGNLAIQHRTVPPVSLSHTGIDIRALDNSEKALRAVSNILGPEGSGRIGTPMLSAAIGDFGASHNKIATRALDQLEKAGVIKRELVFDPDELLQGRRVRNAGMSEERVNELVRSHVIERPTFYPDDTRPVEQNMKETPVISILDKKYLAKDSAPTPLSSLDPGRIRSLYDSGNTQAEIADLLGISASTVSGVLAS